MVCQKSTDIFNDIGNVVISLTMALLVFLFFFFDMYEKGLRDKLSRIKGVDPHVEEKLNKRIDNIDVIRWIFTLAAACFFVFGALLVIYGLILADV